MVELVLRVVLSLAVILGLLWFIARTSSRRFGGTARSMVRVVARQPLARTASLAVVEVGERVLVVGVSENGVNLLTELDPSEVPVEQMSPATGAEAAGDASFGAGVQGPLPEVVRGTVSSGTRRATSSRGLDGSVLSAQTWRQAWAAATGRNGGSGD
ncbi:MAG TPA: flagellar biosynthetic protein FliO [Nocardioidaceae bacterium]|nr:flagellar biosynthetic protein FliO [Nocardioidaceae bacterium]